MRSFLILFVGGLMTATAWGQNEPAVLVIHGGAGVLTEAEMKAEGLTRDQFVAVLAESLRAGHRALGAKKSGVDAVEAAIRVLEDSELYNAGKGAVLTSDGRAELDAAIMIGTMATPTEPTLGKKDPRKRAGAVSGVTHVKNPIAAARAVLEMTDSRHCFLVGQGAEDFVLSDANRAKFGIERVSNLYFWTDRHVKEIRKRAAAPVRTSAVEPSRAEHRMGTVGAVARDPSGSIVAGTSTGGVTNKMPGRVGDCPLIGSGTYADDRACGVSCTGTGEVFIRHAVAHDVVARMVYGKTTVTDAVNQTIASIPDEPGGVGGLIALGHDGTPAFGMSKLTQGMARGYVTADGKVYVALYANEPLKAVP